MSGHDLGIAVIELGGEVRDGRRRLVAARGLRGEEPDGVTELPALVVVQDDVVLAGREEVPVRSGRHDGAGAALGCQRPVEARSNPSRMSSTPLTAASTTRPSVNSAASSSSSSRAWRPRAPCRTRTESVARPPESETATTRSTVPASDRSAGSNGI